MHTLPYEGQLQQQNLRDQKLQEVSRSQPGLVKTYHYTKTLSYSASPTALISSLCTWPLPALL